jgi:hypothetical protein
MALKLTINDPVEVIGPWRDEYKKGADGKYHLVLDGAPDSAKLSEFRERNISLIKEVEELRPLKQKYEGIDPDAAKAALASATELTAKLAKFEGVDPDEYRTLKARPDATTRAAELETRLAAEKAAHASTLLKHLVTAEFLRVGGRASAIDFMATAAAQVFAMEDGKLTTKELSTSNPSEPLSISEWMAKQNAAANFAFQPSRGGGAGSTSPTRFAARSDQKILKDPTPQQLGEHASAIAKGDLKIEYS